MKRLILPFLLVLSGALGLTMTSASVASTCQVGVTTCNGLVATICCTEGQPCRGTDGDDVIIGTEGDDTIFGFRGNDTICGLGGNDVINAGEGNDWVDGGPGDDRIHGGYGDDTLYGGEGNDELAGQTGNDNLQGGPGRDRLYGDGGDDFLNGGADGEKDVLNCGAGNDRATVVDAEELHGCETISAGIVGPAGGTVFGARGTSVTLPAGAIDYEVFLDIAPVAPSLITAPTGNLVPVAAVVITFEPAIAFSGGPAPPRAPLRISIPAPAGTPNDSRLIVGQQVLIDSINSTPPGLREQLVPVDTAGVVDGSIMTQTKILPGIRSGGVFAIVQTTEGGYVTGRVSDAQGVGRPGVVVSNDTNPFVAVTDPGTGEYTIFISGDVFTVTGFDPFRGAQGSASGSIPTSGMLVPVPMSLSPMDTPVNTRSGIRNGGFELEMLETAPHQNIPGWKRVGSGRTERKWGPTSIFPTEGRSMAVINTGPNAMVGVGSSLIQKFRLPHAAGGYTLRLEYNFISEEFDGRVGSTSTDKFTALIRKADGTTTNFVFPTPAQDHVSVNQSGGHTPIGKCGSGTANCGQTGWHEASVNLLDAGVSDEEEIELVLSVIDAGDNLFDTYVLIDNIRFSTVYLHVKIIDGATVDKERIRKEIYGTDPIIGSMGVIGAAEILSQAGINVQLSKKPTMGGQFPPVTIKGRPDQPMLLNFNVDPKEDACPLFAQSCPKFTLGPNTKTLMSLERSGEATDVNVYYVRSLQIRKEVNTGGMISADEYHDVTHANNSGIILPDAGGSGGGSTLAHELGHLLIFQRIHQPLEHGAEGATTIKIPEGMKERTEQVYNIMNKDPEKRVAGIISQEQSCNINRAPPCVEHVPDGDERPFFLRRD